MSAIVVAGCSAWTVWIWVNGLPAVPWIAVAVGIAVVVPCFCFVYLDRFAAQVVNRCVRCFNWTLLLCLLLAIMFSRPGQPFPIWAAIPIGLTVLAILISVLILGPRSFYRSFRLWRITRNLCTTYTPDSRP